MTDGDHEHDPIWTEETWRQWDDYADQVTVQVRFKAWAGAEDESETWLISSDGAAWSKEWLKRQVVDLAAVDSSGGCCGAGTYLLDSRERTTEWGASASVFEIVLTLAQDQLSNATWAAMGYLSSQLATRLREKRKGEGWESQRKWNVEEARSAALNAVRPLVPRNPEGPGPEVRSVEMRDDGAMVIEIRDQASGFRFTVDVRSPGEEVFLARVRKITSSDGE